MMIAFQNIHQKAQSWADFFWFSLGQESNCWKLFLSKTCLKSKTRTEDKKVKTESFSRFFRLSFFAKVIASEAFQARNSCQTSLSAQAQ